ncbi:MAG: sensor histidine kinase, partial [Thermoguttaceae bacterium]|nr:sensor histidine kinase [Thermoguttaceae bacterium]
MDKPKPISSEEMTESLQAQYTEIAQLAGGLAHEVKNPLSTIRLNMELLGEEIE